MKKTGQSTAESTAGSAGQRSELIAVIDELVVLENRIRLLGNRIVGNRAFSFDDEDDKINYDLSHARNYLRWGRQIVERELEMNNIIAIITELGELEERTRELMGQFDYGIAADYRVASGLSQELSAARNHLVRSLQIAAESMQ